MRFLVIFALVAAASASAGVVELTPDNFDSVVDGSKHVFVKFFAPWCGHCKTLAPQYELVGEAFAKTADVVIAKVDADAHSSLGSRFGVQGFPTLKFFPKGKHTEPQDYNGGRQAEDLVAYINDAAGSRAYIKKAPSDVVVLTAANFDKYDGKDRLVEFYAPWCGHCKNLAPTYEKLGNVFASEDGVMIGKVDCDANSALCQKYGVSGYPTIKFFPRTASEPVAYESGRDLDSFVNFINDKAGTKRLSNGRFMADVGRDAALDELAKKFIDPSCGDRAAVLADVDKLAKAAKHGNIYSAVFKKVQEKGGEYVASETVRLQKLIDGGNVAPKKVDEFQIRLNILSAFAL